ncbi:MAG TPA: hypothetical protein ENN49_07320 [Bacteroidales bacterium]|nr:hypothetical protein [Bacteroidales bacterium]
MKQKTLLMMFSIIGIFSSMSCHKIVDEKEVHHHTFVNQSGYNIRILKYYNNLYKDFVINNNEGLSQWIELTMGDQSDDVLIAYGDSAIIFFNDERSAKYNLLKESKFNFLIPSNHEFIYREGNESYFKYTFTVDDYNAATIDKMTTQ